VKKIFFVLTIILLAIFSTGCNRNNEETIYEPEATVYVDEDIQPEYSEEDIYPEYPSDDETDYYPAEYTEEVYIPDELVEDDGTDEFNYPDESSNIFEDSNEVNSNESVDAAETEVDTNHIAVLSSDPFERYLQAMDFLTNNIFAVDLNLNAFIVFRLMGLIMMEESFNGRVQILESPTRQARQVFSTFDFGEFGDFDISYLDFETIFFAPLLELTRGTGVSIAERGNEYTITVVFDGQNFDEILDDLFLGLMLDDLLDDFGDISTLIGTQGEISISLSELMVQITTNNLGIPLSKSILTSIAINLDGVPMGLDINLHYTFNAFDSSVNFLG